ncbi:hypothetical protein PQR72_20695 [Paraburkholderia madseniana]|uniref:hypothetical protein n=1 Tax=Paraburkholderia madseniana TaxID=2599607 RepID=UPI0015C54666|nr:hypothetical protein [Paraburkholderia madseniana]NPT66370.1 hypothetical protein [Paraburkholderia madseniana]
MTEKLPASAHNPAYIFIPTQATLGYPNRFKKLRAVTQRRRKFLEFSQKLHSILVPLSGERYAIYEELTVLTIDGFAGRTITADCVVLTSFGVFIVRDVPCSGRVRRGSDANTVRIETTTGESEIYACPVADSAPAVHFLSALLADFRCPIETIAIIDDELCDLGFGVSTSMLKLSELHHFFRVRRERAWTGNQSFDIHAIGERLRIGCRLVTGSRPEPVEAED